MRIRTLSLLAGSSLLAASPTMFAQTTNTAGASPSEGFALEEVVVTARRRSESLQDVPQTVNAVTSDAVEKLNILKFEDVQAVVPGLTLASGNTGYTTAATMRGADFQVESGASPTVEFYLNDSPIQSNFLFQSLYDLGQIEVLRGPQGTLRGRASPSGSITVTTRAPDLSEFGGGVSMTATNQHGTNTQGAINLPIITDKLALRVAGTYDENEYDQVRSIHNDADPLARTKSGRATLRAEPTDSLSATVMYQWLQRDLQSFDMFQSFHLASPTAPVVNTAADPEIHARQRLGVSDGSRDSTQEMDIVNGQVDWHIAGQVLSYVGSYTEQDIDSLTPQDLANRVPNFEFYQDALTHETRTAHELRLASEERLFGFLDYTVGAFYLDTDSSSEITNNTLVGILAGSTIMPVTTVPTQILRESTMEEKSVFGGLTAHLGERTELSGGVRHIEFETVNSMQVGALALPSREEKDDPTIYSLAASYRVTEDLLVYANYGTSWRYGPTAEGVFRPLTPRLREFTELDPETSKSYEVGFKADLLGNRLRLNLSAFHQDYSDYLYRGPSVYYVNLSQAGATPATFNFVANVDATVDGAELEVAYQPIDDLTIQASFSYAKGEIDNGLVACNDFDGDGRPDTFASSPTTDQIRAAAGGEEVAECLVNDRLSTSPEWTLTIVPEYATPISASMDAFVRGLFTYYDKNEQDPNNIYDDVDSYGLLNLYTGIRSSDGAWEVSVFAKNVTNTGEILSLGPGPTGTNYQRLMPPTFQTTEGSTLASPYMSARYTPPREIGLSVRYAFGSR